MFDTVIVGVDGHDDGRAAIALAKILSPDGEIVLVHAYPLESAAGRALLLGYGQRLHREAERYLECVAAEARLDERSIEVVADTSPARALHRAAVTHDADLIVVGSAHHGRMGRLLLGDVSRSVLNDATCPVAVAPRGFDGPPLGRIGAGFDGSPEAVAAVRAAGDLAAALDAQLSVLTVVDLTWPIWSGKAYVPDVKKVEDAGLEEAREHVRSATAQLPVPTETRAVVGFASTELARLASEVDVIFVGSRGYGPVRRTVLGSMSDRLIHEAACPVIVMPRGVSVQERSAGDTAAHVSA